MTKSEKYLEAEKTLPKDLIPVFEEMVSDYKFIADSRHGRGYVSYIVLADMVKAGWRPTSENASV